MNLPVINQISADQSSGESFEMTSKDKVEKGLRGLLIEMPCKVAHRRTQTGPVIQERKHRSMRVIESERLWVFPISNYHTDCYVK